MLHSMKDLLSGRVAAGERTLPVREIFFRMRDWRLRYLAVDTGGWFGSDEVLLSTDLLAPPTAQRTEWAVEIPPDALETAPRWSDYSGAEGIDLTGWPPIMVGPFGGTYAPILLYEQMLAQSETEPSKDTSPENDAVARMQHANSWLGLPAFGRDGELGVINDLLFEGDTLDIRWFLVGESGVLPSGTDREISVDAVRYLARQGSHLVLDVGQKEPPAKTT